MNILLIICVILVMIFMILSLLKIYELFIATIWVIRKGKNYRYEFFQFIDNGKETHSIKMEEIHKLDDKYQIQWPIIKTLILSIGRHHSKAKSDMFPKFTEFCLATVYRQPALVALLSVFLILFFLLFPNAINHYVLYHLIIICMSIILVLVFFELIYLFLRRLFLGFADNFREDFERNPVHFYAKKEYKWSISEFIYKNVQSIIIFLISSIIGFYTLFCGIYRMDNQSFSFDVCVNRIHYMIQLAYFTIVTFATVGYGDIRPASAFAQIAVALEIIYAMGIMILFLFLLSNTLSEK